MIKKYHSYIKKIISFFYNINIDNISDFIIKSNEINNNKIKIIFDEFEYQEFHGYILIGKKMYSITKQLPLHTNDNLLLTANLNIYDVKFIKKTCEHFLHLKNNHLNIEFIDNFLTQQSLKIK